MSSSKSSKQKISRQLSLLSSSSHQTQLKYQYGPHTTVLTLTIAPITPVAAPVTIHSSTLSFLEINLVESYVYSMMDMKFRYPGKMLLFSIEQVGVLDYTLGSVFECILYSLMASGLEMERTLVPIVICTTKDTQSNTGELEQHTRKQSTKKWKIYQPKFKVPETESIKVYDNWDNIILYTFEHELMVGCFVRSGSMSVEQMQDAITRAREHIPYQRGVVRTLAEKFLGGAQ